MVSPRGTSFISGLTSDDNEIWAKPMRCASVPISRSCPG
ncbi:Uncharacterised protein [Mycobacterium tuberculosis]|uniref:Uncharacterized protein n=1 Tax=Mycobacterium tuberculosis TaxID=1773 RepID=A0A0U0U6H2_MYCTX|nr:Uncharacterised protein [Mycobacterium tuberculosis]COW94296.1 Uncharacterised protein [Mycobacterium tuberculosis]COY54685.1 Uncharacterised protein [Mycobacterium tuberculosis]COY91300.1 Uncharacterised protein [Mycobacterium tuberculosis]